jgi:nucleoid-associated protein YgaU
MGFFDFLRGSGKQVELKPEALKAEIGELGYSASSYEVLVDEGKVTVRGMAGSQEEREKVILALGNIEGVEKVEDQIAVTAAASTSALPVSPNATAPDQSRFHTVKPGDSLSKIAREVYGDANAYMTIFTANNPMLKDPDKIYPGQVLRIPERGHRA